VIDSPPIRRACPGDGRRDQLGNFNVTSAQNYSGIKTPAGSSSPLPQHTLVPQMQALIGIILDRCITDAHYRGVSGY
jgi:hypothetical protein